MLICWTRNPWGLTSQKHAAQGHFLMEHFMDSSNLLHLTQIGSRSIPLFLRLVLLGRMLWIAFHMKMHTFESYVQLPKLLVRPVAYIRGRGRCCMPMRYNLGTCQVIGTLNRKLSIRSETPYQGVLRSPQTKRDVLNYFSLMRKENRVSEGVVPCTCFLDYEGGDPCILTYQMCIPILIFEPFPIRFLASLSIRTLPSIILFHE